MFRILWENGIHFFVMTSKISILFILILGLMAFEMQVEL